MERVLHAWAPDRAPWLFRNLFLGLSLMAAEPFAEAGCFARRDQGGDRPSP